jgi:hypothetical protein
MQAARVPANITVARTRNSNALAQLNEQIRGLSCRLTPLNGLVRSRLDRFRMAVKELLEPFRNTSRRCRLPAVVSRASTFASPANALGQRRELEAVCQQDRLGATDATAR